MLAPGSDRIPVELLQILTQYAICQLPAPRRVSGTSYSSPGKAGISGLHSRLPCPWDSLGKNTGVGCHFLLQRMKVKSEREITQSCPPMAKVMRKEARHTQRWDRASGVPLEILEHLPP